MIALRAVAVATAIVSACAPAFAADALEAPAIEAEAADEAVKPVTVYIDNYATFDDTGAAYSYHEIDVLIEGTVGDWTLGFEGWGGISVDYDLEDALWETPGFLVSAESDSFGRVEFWDASNALSNACITPTLGSSHFGTDDLLSFGLCGGYSGKVLLYTSPDLGGFGVQVSAMDDLLDESDVGAVESSVSAALTYSGAVAGDLTVDASFGVDAATSVNGGLAPDQSLPVTVQAGINVGLDGWLFGAAAQYEFNSLAGGDSWALGAGIGKAVTEQLVLNAELSVDGYEDSGFDYDEVSVGATAEYQIDEDLYVDAAINVVHLTGSDGTDTTSSQFGTGVYWSF